MNVNLQEQVNSLMQKVQQLTIQLNRSCDSKIEVYQDVYVDITQPGDVSLDIFKSLPEFYGDRNDYATWRSMANTAMHVFGNHQEGIRYYEALMILRNKITGTASSALYNYNTAFNFEAIIDGLDFVYADKRPMYILEQELLVLQQNELTLNQFYDEVNKKLNCIVNKINMSHKELLIANALIEGANFKALRTFITGINDKKGELLYTSNPTSLAEAYAKLQTIINDQQRMQFATQFNKKEEEFITNAQFTSRESQNKYCNQSDNSGELLDVEEYSYQEISSIEDDSKYQKTIVEDEHFYDISSDDDERSSIFLGD